MLCLLNQMESFNSMIRSVLAERGAEYGRGPLGRRSPWMPPPNLAVLVYADSNASDASDSNATARREPATVRREPAFSDLH